MSGLKKSSIEIGRQLEETRKALGWSLREAQEKSGVSNGYISQIERGEVDPSPEVLKRFSEAYGVPYERLMEAAGFIAKRDESDPKHKVPSFVFSAAERMDEDDWRAAQAFFRYLLNDKQKQRDSTRKK